MEFDYDFERAERNEKIKKFFLELLVMIIAIAAAVALAWAITKFALEKTNMVGDSMAETLIDKDTILINKMAYLRKGPERFDVIVFEISGREHSFYSIRRVIGLPGENVRILDGYVYINGEKLDEPINVEELFIEGLALDGIQLDEDEYFVLGDNRNDSEDSRFANIGNVVGEQIIGKAWLRLNKFGFVNSLNKKEDNPEDKDSEQNIPDQ
ncbi:MAG: signal peptidase I [Lachnospiraceae bacterium]|nr:signal peptidase I [Lachnospiraceae bacterium]